MPASTDGLLTSRRARAAVARLRDLMAGLGCTPAECVALSVLVAGALIALGLVWFLARPGPPPVGPPAGGVRVEAEKVVVHVAGQVARPGLYRLPGGSRVADALDAAGGPLPGAVLDGLNLARPLTDGEQVVAPAASGGTLIPGEALAGATPGAPAPAARPDGKLDLNRATLQDFDALPGIGPVLAERIVSYRREHGPFKTLGGLRDVPGIGEKTFQKLAPLLVVG